MADITAVALYMHYWTLFQPVPQWVIALIALALVFCLNLMSVKMYGEAEFWFALIKVGTIIVFMVVAIACVILGAPVGSTSAGISNITDYGGLLPMGLAPVFALTLGVVYAFGGTEMVGVAAGEAKEEAVKQLPRAINSMIVRIFVFYVGSVILMAIVLPYTGVYLRAVAVRQRSARRWPCRMPIPLSRSWLLAAALSSLNAGLYATSRTLRSMAIAGSGPKFAARMNRNKVPYGDIVVSVIAGAVRGILLNYLLPSDAFDIIMNLAGIGIAGTWCMILITHLAFLKQVKAGKEKRPDYLHRPALP